MNKIHIPISGKEYDVIIQRGILSKIAEYIDKNKELVIVTDNNIPSVYLDNIAPKLGYPLVLFIKEGETSKSIEVAYRLINEMISYKVTRGATIIALGGGVVGDLCGFIASIYMRGIDFIQIPTTLLAQIDSSVGGKVGINAENMKNAIGSFKQPKLVLVDSTVLETLDAKQTSNGLAEMIKYGLISSKSLFTDLLNNDIFEDIDKYISDCIKIKTAFVVSDEYDLGERQLLNYGHTIGHAIEQESKYTLLHGEAISIGMMLMAKDQSFEKDLEKTLLKYNLPISHNLNKENLYKYIITDKKVIGDTLNLIMVEEPGKGFIKPITKSKIKKKL
jgi:3-dehydroquinate synthase